MLEVRLSAREAKDIDDLVAKLFAVYRSATDPEFLRTSGVWARDLPRRLSEEVEAWRLAERDAGCLIRGLSIPDDLVRTPAHWREAARDGLGAREEVLLVLLANLVGDVFGWATQQDGRLVHDVLPIRDHENEQLGSGSKQTLWWHTEDAFHPLRGDYLALLCLRNPAVLVTGLGVHSATQLAAARQALGSQPATAAEDFTERQAFGDGVYTAAEWGAEREMCLHHEQAHGIEFPGLLLMACPKPPVSGGAVLLGDTRAVLRELPVALVHRFHTRGWSLVRNYRPYLGVSWVAAFGVSDPVEVEAICAQRLTGFAWLPDGVLRTVQRRAAVVHHPLSGDACWFNQIAFFSQWSLPPEQRNVMVSVFGAYGMPFNTVYGDATELAEDEVTAVLEAYDRVLVRVEPHPGDLLLVDNVNTAHGRDPFTGDRQALVALADPIRLTECAPTVGPGPDFAAPDFAAPDFAAPNSAWPDSGSPAPD